MSAPPGGIEWFDQPDVGQTIRPEVLLAMLELWATVDTVFTEYGAFGSSSVSLGTIYRSWQKARAMLGEPVATSPVTRCGHNGSTHTPETPEAGT